MRNKLLLSVVVVLSIIYSNIERSTNNDTSFFNNENTINVKENSIIINYNVENYLEGVLAGEMPASFEMEALKAQAVAARTFAYYKINTSNEDYDLTNDTSSQVHISNDQMKEKWKEDYDKYLNKIKDAINQTKDEVLTYKNEIIPTYYFSMSNGYTEDVKYVFGEKRDYLQSVESKEDENNPNYKSQITMTKEQLKKKLNINDFVINDIKRTNSHRVDIITIDNKIFKGTEIRKILNLRSTDFEIKEEDNNVEITTYGYGHGVGMSQYGANQMAKEGLDYKQILKHYYQNTNLVIINNVM